MTTERQCIAYDSSKLSGMGKELYRKVNEINEYITISIFIGKVKKKNK